MELHCVRKFHVLWQKNWGTPELLHTWFPWDEIGWEARITHTPCPKDWRILISLSWWFYGTYFKKDFCEAVECLNRGMGKKSSLTFTSNSKSCTAIMYFINWKDLIALIWNVTFRVTTIPFKELKWRPVKDLREISGNNRYNPINLYFHSNAFCFKGWWIVVYRGIGDVRSIQGTIGRIFIWFSTT